ncbi:MAG: Ig-like domain-containing protein [Coriobacteriia bacterium]|nr:Ig-like domain-containing protein [Coriobacteriia bacterium]
MHKLLTSLLLGMVLLVSSPFTLTACSDKNAPLAVTYIINSWKDVQLALDSANNGDTIDLSGLWSPNQQIDLKIPSSLEVVLVGHEFVSFIGVSITCAGRNKVTIDNLSITALNNQAQSAMHFAGKQNQLILQGSNSITYSKAAEKPGYGAAIGVPKGTDLMITSSEPSYLTAAGANGAATIGGGQGKPNGSISIDAPLTDFHISYSGGGAGIGGGSAASALDITIQAGSFYIEGEDLGLLHMNNNDEGNEAAPAAYGAGIGGGSASAGGKTTISGGQLHLVSYGGAACIGGGNGGDGGEIAITGGRVSALNRGSGTCLGGGDGGKEASIIMQGGSIYVSAAGTAVNGAFSELPVVYLWLASDEPIGDSDTLRASHGDPYRGSGTFSHVVIEAHEIVSVTLSPQNTEVARGGTMAFEAQVVATGGANTGVRWSITGNYSAATMIDSEGSLTVALNESAETIIVVATSITYSDKYGEASVTVVDAPRD